MTVRLLLGMNANLLSLPSFNPSQSTWGDISHCRLILLFCSLAVLDPRVGHTLDVLSPFIPVLCHSDRLFHGSPVHVLMLYIQAVRCLPCLRAPGTVPCIISFSRQLPCFLMVWPQFASFLALTVCNSSLFTPALLATNSFVFSAVCDIFSWIADITIQLENDRCSSCEGWKVEFT